MRPVPLPMSRYLACALALWAGCAHADDYGCTVLLCLSNPAGPTAVAPCIPPMQRLWQDLAHFRPFPACTMADGSNGNAGMAPVIDAYDPCPPGTTAAQPGTQMALGSAGPGGLQLDGPAAASQPGYACGAGCAPYGNRGPRACVAAPLGNIDGAAIYGVLQWQDPKGPTALDVYMDNRYYGRVQP